MYSRNLMISKVNSDEALLNFNIDSVYQIGVYLHRRIPSLNCEDGKSTFVQRAEKFPSLFNVLSRNMNS